MPALSIAAFALISLRFAVAFRFAPEGALVPAAALAAVSVSGLIAWVARVAPRPHEAVRELDRRAGAEGRLIAAFELAGSDDPFARAAVEDASAAVSAVRVARLFRIRTPREASRAALLVALAPVTMLALRGASWDLSRGAPDPTREERFAADGDRLARIAERLDLPTMKYVVQETRRLLAAIPAPQPTPAALALGPAPAPVRGATITDPEARKFFEEVLSGATSESVGKEIVQRFTEETRSAAYEILESEFKTRNLKSGSRYEVGPNGGSGSTGALPEMKGAGGGMAKPAFDPKKMKSDYLADKDQQSELMGAIKESFDSYLREFAAELLKGMEDALENELSGNGKGVGRFKSPKGLPDSPSGMAEHAEGTLGAPIPAKGGNPTSKMQGQMALGGTEAGGAGAGAGGANAERTDGGDASGQAQGERLDLGGTLDEKLARIEVIRRMSGGSKAIEDSAAAEIVEKSTKAAEAEAAVAEDVPDEWRGAIEAYFRNVRGESKEEKKK